MSNLWIQEDWVSVEEEEQPDGSIEDHRTRLGSSDVYETAHEKPGELFRDLQREYGRCVSRVYIGEGTPIGWVFEKKDRYTDTKEAFMRETWVTVHTAPPTETIKYHYAELG